MKHLQGDWLDIAKALPSGGKLRTGCSDGCGSDNSQLVSHNERGYSRHCFRCKANDFVPHGIRRIADINRHKRERKLVKEAKVELPKDYTLDVPRDGMLWYLKYGISPELASEYEIGYSAYYDRVVLPVRDGDELIAVQMRAVRADQKPKYLNPAGPKVAAAVFMSAPPTGITVVVEDILSAIKVGRVAHCTSILGTSMTDQRAEKIARLNHTAIVWLDNDKAGRAGRLEASRQLRLLGMTVFEVRTERDPKTYSIEEIKEHLRSMKNVN